MFLNLQKAIEKGIFSAPDSVCSLNVGDTQIVRFKSHEPRHFVDKISTFLRRREDKSVVEYTLMVIKNRTGRLEFCWKSNVKPKDAEIFVQKLSEFRS